MIGGRPGSRSAPSIATSIECSRLMGFRFALLCRRVDHGWSAALFVLKER